MSKSNVYNILAQNLTKFDKIYIFKKLSWFKSIIKSKHFIMKSDFAVI